MITTQEAANLLLQARMTHQRIDNLPETCCPKDISQAYQCQNKLTEQMSKKFGGKRLGYKIACTNKTAQALVNVDGPFFGPLLSPFVMPSPAELITDNFFMRVIEPEFGFIMGASLPARDALYQQDEIIQAIGSILPAIEIVDSRYKEWTKVGAPSLIADNACNAAWIYGKPYTDWQKFDLSQHPVNLYVNGTLTRQGSGAMVLGNPLNVVTWLANTLSKQGNGLQAGDFISTGITCEVYMAQKNDQILADFGPFGSVELSFA